MTKVGGIISNKIILPMLGFKALVLMNCPLGKFTYTNGGIIYEYPKEILDCNTYIHYLHVVSGIVPYMDYTWLI